MAKTEIYADVLFFINFCMDLICLYVSAKICRAPVKAYRLLSGSALGGAYAVAACGMEGPVSFVAATAASFVICLTALGGKDAVTVIKRNSVFFAVSLTLGGATYFFFSITGKNTYYNGTLYFETGAFAIIFVGAVSASFLLLLLRKSRSTINAVSALTMIEVNGKEKTFSSFVDSGLLLCDPISADPVILIKKASLESFIGKTDPTTLRGFRIIPSDRGPIYAFRPEKIGVKSDGKPYHEVNALMGIDTAGGTFSDMEVLIPSSIM